MLAHAFGQRYDLPLPLLLFVAGGAVVVLASFALMMATQAQADVAPDTGQVADDAAPSRVRPVPAGLSILALVLFVACGVLGSQEVAENLVPTVFWLVIWIAVPLSCGVLGDWTRPVNPFAALAALCDRPGLRRVILGSEETVAWPSWLGWWPATVLFFGLACAELVFNLTATLPRHTAAGLACYALICAIGGLLFGERWTQRGEVFSVLFSTWGRLGYFRFGAPGRPGFTGGLDTGFEPVPSRVAFVLLLLISVNFDGLLATPSWSSLERRTLGLVAQDSARLEAFRTLSFVGLAVLLTAVFAAFAFGSQRAGGRRGSGALAALTQLLPSLVPIAFGYLLAHNLQYLMVNSQLLFPLIGNPTGSANWPLHLPYPFNDSYEPNLNVLPSALTWYLAVAVIVAVHIVAVVIAHRQLDPGGRSRAGFRRELPWLAAMVGYTMLSLWLLAQPLVQESAPAASVAGLSPVVTRHVG